MCTTLRYDRNNRRTKASKVNDTRFLFRDQCDGVEADVEQGIDCTDKPVDDQYMSRISEASEISAEDDGDRLLGTMDADGSDHEESMNGTRRARNMRPRRPITVTRVSKIAKKKKRIRRKFAIAQATIPAAKVPLGLGTIGARLVFPLVLLFFLFAFLYLCFDGQNLFLYVVFLFVHLLQFLSCRSRLAEVNPVWMYSKDCT